MLVLLVKSYSFFPSQTEVNLLFPDSLGAGGFSSAPTTAGPLVYYDNHHAVVLHCFHMFLPTGLMLPDSRDPRLSTSAFPIPKTVCLQILAARKNLLFSVFFWSKSYICQRLIYLVIIWIKLICIKKSQIAGDLKLYSTAAEGISAKTATIS